ncbi:MAG: FAD-binding oxidoreductase [Alphaproteobacteria bacterium]|nr:FAD-binding oxidoreductase [Alphaproteobacteria bacterium]
MTRAMATPSLRPASVAPLPPGLVERFAAIVGPAGIVADPAAMEPWLIESRGLYRGASPLVLRPASTAEVAEVVRLAHAHRVAIVPQGGNTGLVGGAVAQGQMILALGRMNRVRAVDPVDYTMTVDAGCILADLQVAAAAQDRLFPLSLGAEGSCQIGGNLSTNAGGTQVLRYGNTRELCLGLEVVLPDGRVWDGLRALRKNNTGYDLKHLFIGGEGTLGIITGAVLRLFPLPKERPAAFVALAGLDEALELLSRLRRATGDALSGFELIPRLAIDLARKHNPVAIDPLAARHDWYALVEAEAAEAGGGLGGVLEAALGTALEDGIVVDAAIAQSEQKRRAFWHLREALVLAQAPEGASIKNDVSVPVSRVPDFIRRATAAVLERCPEARPLPFGHVGDGNVHFNIQQPVGGDDAAFLARWDELTGAVNEVVAALGGSFSAEHGIGRLKVADLRTYKNPVELDMMRAIKRALDPDGLMNPGAML